MAAIAIPIAAIPAISTAMIAIIIAIDIVPDCAASDRAKQPANNCAAGLVSAPLFCAVVIIVGVLVVAVASMIVIAIALGRRCPDKAKAEQASGETFAHRGSPSICPDASKTAAFRSDYWRFYPEQKLKQPLRNAPRAAQNLWTGGGFRHILPGMGLFETAAKTLGRARYTAAQGLRSAWYGAHYGAARRNSAGFNRPGEPAFRPENDVSLAALRKAYFDLWRRDRANVEAGLYGPPKDVRLRDLPKALKASRAFFADVREVDRRRVARSGVEVRASEAADPDRYPTYYRQNFHYQTDGWLSDESAEIYDTQVEALFTGAADAMRRAALAEISRELKGKDQRAIKLLDVACGTGRFLTQVMETFPKVQASGLDLSPNYAAHARGLLTPWPQVEVIEGQAEAMPFADASRDIVVCIYLFHELPPRVRPDVMKEIARVLKPGGLFVMADSAQFGDNPKLDGILEYFPEGFHEPYYKGYLSYDFAPVMEAAGFTEERKQMAFLTKVTTWRFSTNCDQ